MRLWVPVENLKLVGELELLEKPEDALRAGLFEPGVVLVLGSLVFWVDGCFDGLFQ